MSEYSQGSCSNPCPEDYRMLIKRAWEDLHHSRTQEWRALVAITGAHLVIFQAVKYGYAEPFLTGDAWPALVGGGISLAAACVGALVVFRHRRLMQVKMRWIYRAEDFLGLIRATSEDELTEAGDGTESVDTEDPGIIPRNRRLETPIKWNGLSWPRFLSTSWLILALFVLLILLDTVAIVIFSA